MLISQERKILFIFLILSFVFSLYGYHSFRFLRTCHFEIGSQARIRQRFVNLKHSIQQTNLEKFDELKSMYSKISAALSLDSQKSALWYNQGIVLSQLMEVTGSDEYLTACIDSLETSVKLDPSNSSSWYLLATIYEIYTSEFMKAIDAYKHSIENAIDNSNIQLACFTNLVSLYMKHGFLDSAAKLCDTMVQTYPLNPLVWLNTGIVLRESTHYELAVTCLQKAKSLLVDNTVDLNNESGQILLINTLINLAFVCNKLGLVEDAMQFYSDALQSNPNDESVYLDLAQLYIEHQQYLNASEILQLCIDKFPSNENAKYLLVSIKSHIDVKVNISVDSTPREYVESLFDYYADDYEDHMLLTLNYTVPNKIMKVMEENKESLELFRKNGKLIELGVGTGLMGREFRLNEFCGEILGCDISSKMISMSSSLRYETQDVVNSVYNRLETNDCEAFLANQDCAVDFIVAADVFCYYGNLDQLFRLVSKTLKENGYFCFSIEALDSSINQDHILQSSARYCHNKSYILKLLKDTNFQIISFQDAFLRSNDLTKVSGAIVLAKKIN